MVQNIAMDLGTSTVLIYIKGKGVVLNEPSVIVVDKYSNKIIKVGREAQDLIGRAPENIEVVKPVREGVISRYRHTMLMMQKFIRKGCGKMITPPNITIAVPSVITDVEELAVRDAAVEAGAKDPLLIDEPVAAAIGAGLDIMKPEGNMVVDIGGGTTDIAVISLGGAVLSNSIKTAGDAMTEAVIKYIKNRYSLIIGEHTAEDVKIKIGSVWRRDELLTMNVKGKNINSGTPQSTELNSYDMTEALEDPITKIIEAICSVIEKTPPELVSDIAKNGIVLTGGGCQIYGLDNLIKKVTGLPARVAPSPETCVVIGAGRAVDIGLTADKGKYINKT